MGLNDPDVITPSARTGRARLVEASWMNPYTAGNQIVVERESGWGGEYYYHLECDGPSGESGHRRELGLSDLPESRQHCYHCYYKRATKSDGRTADRVRPGPGPGPARSTRRRFPSPWPKRSLTTLRWSLSNTATVIGRLCRTARDTSSISRALS